MLASQVSTLNNFVLTELWVFRGHESRGTDPPLPAFNL